MFVCFINFKMNRVIFLTFLLVLTLQLKLIAHEDINSFYGRPLSVSLPGAEYNIGQVILGNDGKLSYNSCNDHQASFSAGNGRFKITSPWSQTSNDCSISYDSKVVDAFNRATNYLPANDLILRDDSGNLLLTLKR